MKRMAIILAVGSVFLMTMLGSQVATAQTSLSESQANLIRQNCTTIQTTLRQLRVSDAGMRTDRGQLYENILTKLMTPFNRMAIDKQGGLALAAITLDYDNQLNEYRDKYRQYERSLSRTIQTSCDSEPDEFYDALSSTRNLRQELHQETNNLIDLLKQFKAEFEDFATEFEDEK